MPRTLSILIPVYNEKATVLELLRRVEAVTIPVAKEIIIVDDGSTDGTRELLKGLGARAKVVLHEKNRGKGAAVRTAITHATGDLIIVQDADLEYDPADYPGLLVPLLDGRADVVYGSRFLGGGAHRVLLFWHYAGNVLFTLLTNVLYNVNLTDMGTCFKVFDAAQLKAIPLRSERFGIEPEITAKICKRQLRLYEVPISYSGRSYAEGKKITWKDGLSYIWCLLRYRIAD
ncbi:MAG: glycosyltransferase family 2 protein [Elusimicrobiota bacterium]